MSRIFLYILKGCQSCACVNNYLVYSSNSLHLHRDFTFFGTLLSPCHSASHTYNLVRLHMISDPSWLLEWKDLLHGSCYHTPPSSPPSFFHIIPKTCYKKRTYESEKKYPWGHRHYIISIIGIDCKKIHAMSTLSASGDDLYIYFLEASLAHPL